MPVYSYECLDEQCKHKSDKLRKLEDRDAPLTCAKCGGEQVRVTALPSPAHFKGTGFTPKFHR